MLRAMNRQLRRAQAKMDKKAEIEKEKRKQARREKVQEARERRRRMREDAKVRAAPGAPAPAARRTYTPEERKRLPGRFSGAFMFATVFFIALQAAVPADQKELGQSLIGAGFFLMYGYFATLFLSRRGLPRALTTAAVGGVTLHRINELRPRIRHILGNDMQPVVLAASCHTDVDACCARRRCEHRV